MAKVMVSMPTELLAAVDAEARRSGSTRSAVLRGFAEDALQRRRTKRARAMREILDDLSEAGLQGHGGNVAEAIKAHRPDR
jgi:metal-responsive CopG/Arc/MetJ family transcriptional regulator